MNKTMTIPTGVRMMEDNRIQGEFVRCEEMASGPMGGSGSGCGASMGGQKVAAASKGLTLCGSTPTLLELGLNNKLLPTAPILI